MGKSFDNSLKAKMQSVAEMLETAGKVRGPAFENMVEFAMLCNLVVQMFMAKRCDDTQGKMDVMSITISHLLRQYAVALKLSDEDLKDSLDMAYKIGTRVYSRADY